MAKRKPIEKPYANGTWTRARFFSFIRSNLRLMSRKWPPIQTVLRKARRPYKGPNKLQKWEVQCFVCKRWYLQKHVHVEHTIPCGSLKEFADAAGFLERMLVEVDGYTVQCKTCHQVKTNKERELKKALQNDCIENPDKPARKRASRSRQVCVTEEPESGLLQGENGI